MLRRLLWLTGLLCLPLAAVADDYLAELVAAAHARHLAGRSEWHALLHYKPRMVRPGVESLADDQSFFSAPDGKINPQSELDATIAAFFSSVAETDKQQHPQCRFIARYHWLKQELGFDRQRLPEQPCRRFHDWYSALDPRTVTLIFPAAYLNSPASLFGHTLLRVDAHGQDERTRLLAHSVNYAAATTESTGLLFAIKGLFGGYSGVFSMSRYHAQVTEYNDLENRDIWEYELAFTPQEIERLLMHVWELGPIYFDYYFFDENCSYHLLSLFDVARPSLRLTDRFPFWTIPADTVRAVAEEPGLLRTATFRPAQSTVLRYRQRQLPEEHVRLARAIAQESVDEKRALEQLEKEERARVLELAFEYLEYERRRGSSPLGDRTGTRLHELLLARSRLDVAGVSAPPAPAIRPDEGHGSSRVALALGRQNGRTYQELRVRPAYHDLLDPEGGYNRGAEIEFLDLTLRNRQDDDRLRIEQVDIIDIVSLSPRDELLRPWSWRLNLGYARKYMAPEREPLVAHLNGGVGFAVEDRAGSLWYALLEAGLDMSGQLEHGYAAGIGVGIGVFADLTSRWRIQAGARMLQYGLGDVHADGEVVVNQRFTFSRHGALRVEFAQRREFGFSTHEAAVSWSIYF